MSIREICTKLGDGYILLVGFNTARLIPRPEILPNETQGYDIPYETVRDMIDCHQLGELNEEGYPPLSERIRGTGWKRGWREMGLKPPMKGQGYYLMVQ